MPLRTGLQVLLLSTRVQTTPKAFKTSRRGCRRPCASFSRQASCMSASMMRESQLQCMALLEMQRCRVSLSRTLRPGPISLTIPALARIAHADLWPRSPPWYWKLEMLSTACVAWQEGKEVLGRLQRMDNFESQDFDAMVGRTSIVLFHICPVPHHCPPTRRSL